MSCMISLQKVLFRQGILFKPEFEDFINGENILSEHGITDSL